ncbi:unnamed protein product [Schistocephalus solidus]|uniref:Gustatory receptor n=1 Tax=Schistocephalus solidus TaxID=70667 RepID=A0A183S712_SCHSO|nr:unnamed protein product [Schistocephalus solidus]
MTSIRRELSVNKSRDSIGSISTLSFQLPSPPDVVQRRIHGHLILVFEVCTLTCILAVVYCIPTMMIRMYNFKGTLSGGALLYEPAFEDKRWMIYEFPDAIDDMFVMMNRSITRLLNETARMDTLNDERRRFMALWHVTYAVYPLIITFLIMAIALHIFIRIHPDWTENATEAPTFGEMVLLIAANLLLMLLIAGLAEEFDEPPHLQTKLFFTVLLQLTLIFHNVHLHRRGNKLLKDLSIAFSDSLNDPVSRKEPLTFCMAPPNNFTTCLLLSLFVNLLVIYSIMDYLDST